MIIIGCHRSGSEIVRKFFLFKVRENSGNRWRNLEGSLLYTLNKKQTKLLTNSNRTKIHSTTHFQQLITKLTKNRHCSTYTSTFSFRGLQFKNGKVKCFFFFFANFDKHDEMQLLAKFKKILYIGFRATLNFENVDIPSFNVPLFRLN